jgi:diaminohydroxyphosphoribosylaminopyrimidine deaminase/5-amino-6-(5-phosphoribosylamino)uracil reductase
MTRTRGILPVMPTRFTEKDKQFMHRAFKLASEAKGRTFPNPAVGAVLVKKNRIVGEGYTAAWGGDHAEIAALRMAGGRARGATLYVTLEPCAHHGRTPPCTNAILAAGIGRVVAALKDPNPLVAGRGFAFLRKHGIVVATGLMRSEACALNEDFCWAITTKRPWVTLKLALTLDGRIADSRGDSQWITNGLEQTMTHRLRSRHAAIVVGRGTVLKDNPSLTVRLVRGHSPARFVFSTTPTLPARLQLVKTPKTVASTIVCPGGRAGSKTIGPGGVAIWHTGTHNPVKMARTFLAMAHNEGLNSIMVEGGSRLASLFLENGLVNRLYLFYGNMVLGNGLSGLAFKTGLSMKKALVLDKIEFHRLGDNFMVTGIVARKAASDR